MYDSPVESGSSAVLCRMKAKLTAAAAAAACGAGWIDFVTTTNRRR